MSKVVKSVSKVFGGPADKPRQAIDRYATRVGGPMTPEELAERRAALATQGRRPKEEELRRQGQMGVRPLQGGGSQSGMWI